MRFAQKLFSVCVIAAVLLTVLSSCRDDGEYPRPSKEYYCNDFADALLPGSRQSIISEGERLYENTKDIEENGGAQIVVATMLLESEDKVAEIDRTELFREWRIGKTDMGLLILMLFVNVDDYKELVSVQIEIGYRMESYITAIRAGEVIDNCLYNPEWNGSIDMGLGEMYYELLSDIYTKAYDYDSFSYDMESYRNFLINYSDDDHAETLVSMGLVSYIFSPYSSPWSKVFVILAFVILGAGGVGGGIFAVRNKGGGGSSGGYGIRR